MDISQSTIKEVLKYGLCPKKFKAYEIDKIYERPPSMAMFRGIYFEYMLLGNLPRSGEVPVYPVGKRGNHEIHKSRIDYQIDRFYDILDKHGVDIIDGVQNIVYNYSPGITLTLTLDSIAIYKDKLYVADIKLSQDLSSGFGHVAWGAYDQMDKLQAHLYSYVMSKVMGEHVGFIYLVFDYKKSKQEFRLFEEIPTKDQIDSMFIRIIDAEKKLKWMEYLDYKPRAYVETCKKCMIMDCPARITEERTAEEVKPKSKSKSFTVDMDELLQIVNS